MEAMMGRIVAGGDDVFNRGLRNEDEELDEKQKLDILSLAFNENKCSFVQKYWRWMDTDDCALFTSEAKANSLLECLLSQIARREVGKRNVRNRRFLAMQKMKKQNSYFSDEKMREREPYLYDQMVGRYLSEQERLELRPTVSAESEEGRTAGGAGWAGLLQQFEESGQTAQRRQWKNEEWDGEGKAGRDKRDRLAAHVNRVMEMDEEELEEEGEGEGTTLAELREEVDEIVAEMDAARDEEQMEKMSREDLRAEFLSLMEERFMGGLDSRFFDYSTVDDDQRLEEDDVIAEREREEKWFDEED